MLDLHKQVCNVELVIIFNRITSLKDLKENLTSNRRTEEVEEETGSSALYVPLVRAPPTDTCFSSSFLGCWQATN